MVLPRALLFSTVLSEHFTEALPRALDSAYTPLGLTHSTPILPGALVSIGPLPGALTWLILPLGTLPTLVLACIHRLLRVLWSLTEDSDTRLLAT
jgi:hypothetical protein